MLSNARLPTPCTHPDHPVHPFLLAPHTGFVLAASNTVAGVLSDMTRQAGLGNTGCFAGGAMACCLAATLLLVFERWGDLGKDELVFRRAKAKKAA